MMYKSGVVAVVGSPNVGKSTLINSLLGQKIAIVSAKPQTTRGAQRGILTTDNTQVIFVDTPGVLRPNYLLDRTMLAIARAAVQDADVVLWIVDITNKPSSEERRVAQFIDQTNALAKVYMAMNKSDLLKPKDVIKHTNMYRGLCDKAIWMLVSAKRGDNVDKVKSDIIDLMPEGPKYYENDEITDKSVRDLSGELLRESALYFLRHEIPHGIAVLVEEFIEKEDGKIEIIATIVVENNRHKGVVIGKNGSMIKSIGIRARREIEKMIEQSVNLQTFVKVKADWRNDNNQLKHMGY